jgi:hypothetical protein
MLCDIAAKIPSPPPPRILSGTRDMILVIQSYHSRCLGV